MSGPVLKHAIFSENDLRQLAQKGIAPEVALAQLARYAQRFLFAQLDRPAVVGDGIVQLADVKLDQLIEHYQQASKTKEVVKFVPASGAATRMFKPLHQFDAEQPLVNQPAVQQFFTALDQFAFKPDLKAHGLSDEQLADVDFLPQLLDTLLSEAGMNYANLPKALIQFHRYEAENRTSLEEHLCEAAHYIPPSKGMVRLHFTITDHHREAVAQRLNAVLDRYQERFDCTFDVTFSTQKPATDTLAANLDHTPFRTEDGQLLMRPGGHGALLENLHELRADLVFLKNIDNVQHDRVKADTYRYKQAMGGLLLHIQAKVFDILESLNNGTFGPTHQQELDTLAQEYLGWATVPTDPSALFDVLNRPIRICGMVKNEGEPGGGPFWVRAGEGPATLQIVEKAQVDPNDADQQALLQSATHFNPVDLVCGIRDFRGQAFHLPDFRDPDTGFISEKSQNGRALLAQEWPGLWNGSMANWITVFVEVPLSTFSPVKTINDLLKAPHQP